MNKNNFSINQILLIFGAVALAIIAYSNHFENAFQFDDDHTIVNNQNIRDIGNIPKFFTDATTTSTLPASQAYRPGLTTLNAIDCYFSKNHIPEPKPFHVSIFLSFILLGFMIFKLSQKIFSFTFNQKVTIGCATFIMAWFWVHTANTGTINYIIARSDSFSTLMVLIGFWMYLYLPVAKKFHLYLIPIAIGFLTKEPAVTFVPLLFVYKLFFEQDFSFADFRNQKSKLWITAKQCVIPTIAVIVLVLFSQKMTPVIWTSGTTNVWGYAMSQPYVYIHYINNFFIPANLVIDTDWQILSNPLDDKVLIGFSFLIGLLYIIYKTSKNHKPVAFGILWFLIALLPSSSFVPLSEVLNDHRPFFPYIGLFIAVVYVVAHFYQKSNFKKVYYVAGITLLFAHCYATFQQNKKWITSESIWQDATIKAPQNGRAWMNFGNSLMARGNYVEAEKCYKKTMSLWPYYAYVYINLGILKDATFADAEAENYFNEALKLDAINPETYNFYAKFLTKRNRFAEAQNILNKGLELSPNHLALNQTKTELLAKQSGKTPKIAENNVVQTANFETYLNLSLEYYNQKQYLKCIEACEKALKLKPDYALAYNNICSAYNELKQWKKAAEAGKKGLAIDPNNALLQGNLNVSLSNLKK